VGFNVLPCGMPETQKIDQSAITDRLALKVAQHGTLLMADEVAIRSVRSRSRTVEPGEDIVSQGESPDVAVLYCPACWLVTTHWRPGTGNIYRFTSLAICPTSSPSFSTCSTTPFARWIRQSLLCYRTRTYAICAFVDLPSASRSGGLP
jgi:hypothetical protein